MGVGFSNISDIAAKLQKFWGGNQASGNVLTFQGEGRAPQGAPGAGAGLVVGRAHLNATNLTIGNTAIPYDNSAPQATEGGSAMLLAYVPVDGSGVNTLRIETVVWLGAPAISVAGDVMTIAIFQGGIGSALAAIGHEVLVSGGQNLVMPLVVEIPNHTVIGSTVWSVRFGLDPGRAGTVFNGDKGNAFRYGGTGTPKSSLTVTEFAP